MLDEPSHTNLEKTVPESEQLWTAEQVADFLGMTTSKLVRLMVWGTIESHPAHPEGRVVSKESLGNYLLAKADDYRGLERELSLIDLELIHGYQNPYDEGSSDPGAK